MPATGTMAPPRDQIERGDHTALTESSNPLDARRCGLCNAPRQAARPPTSTSPTLDGWRFEGPPGGGGPRREAPPPFSSSSDMWRKELVYPSTGHAHRRPVGRRVVPVRGLLRWRRGQRRAIGGSVRRSVGGGWPISRPDGRSRRGRQGRGQADDHRPAARLVQLRRDASTTFKAKYGIEVNELDPDAGSGDEIEAIKANKDNPGPQAPDVIDVGLSFGPYGQGRGPPRALQGRDLGHHPRRRPRTPTATGTATTTACSRSRSTRPSSRTSRRTGPTCSSPSTRARSPSPATRATSNQAIQAVYAAALANGGSLDDAAAGPRLLQAAQRRGQLRAGHRHGRDGRLGRDPDHASAGPTTPCRTAMPRPQRQPGDRGRRPDSPAGSAGVYVQAISAYAPHPNAAKLWMEFLYSDEGQNIWLKGYCHPIRYDDLVASGRRPGRPAGQAARTSTGAVFPTLDQLDAAKTLITEQWDDRRRRRTSQ